MLISSVVPTASGPSKANFFSGADRRVGFLVRMEARGLAPHLLLVLLVGEIHFPQIELPLDPAPRFVL
jgi:hypothetical protein